MNKNEEFYKKLMNETPLSPSESLALDERLESSESVRHLVAALPEETVSLEWRSKLNSKLMEVAKKPAKKRFAWWKPALPFAAAAAVAAVFFVPHNVRSVSQPLASSSNFEAALVQTHQDQVSQLDLTGALSVEAKSEAQPIINDIEWDSSDLDAL